MIIRNGINSTLRAKGRTALFTLLIFALTLILTLGAGMWAYCSSTLAEMDAQYTSIALVEYMGENYPESGAADESARAALDAIDSAAVASVKGVELWEPSDRSLALAEGYQRILGDVPYENRGVIYVFNLSPYYEERMVSLTEDELPDAYCAIDTSTDRAWTCTVKSETIEGEFPFFYFNPYISDSVFRETYSDELGWGMAYYEIDSIGEPFVYLTEINGNILYYENGTSTTFEAEQLYYSGDGSISVFRSVLAGYTGIISRPLYTQENKSEVIVTIEVGESGFTAQSGKSYLIHGEFIDSASGTRTLAITDFYDGCDTTPWLECSGSSDPALSDSIFTQYAEYYRSINNYITLESSGDIAALESFQQGSLYLEEGRFPGADELSACVISGDMASMLKVSTGDSISVTRLSSDASDRFDVSVTDDVRELTVVGITNSVDDYSGCVWLSAAGGGFGEPLFGYELGRAVLDNSGSRTAADTLQAMMPDGVLVTLYDQGYSAAARSIEAMYTTAMAVTLSAAAGALAVLFLFAYLFVGRQRETVSILSCLGTSGARIRGWLLSGACVIAAVSAFTGALVGRLALRSIISAALSAAQSLYSADLRYSEASVGAAKLFESTDELAWWPAPLAGAAVFAAAAVLCLVFLGSALRQQKPKRGKTSVRTPKSGTSVFGSGAGRFALLSAKRGGWRSTVVPAAALALSLFLGILASGASGWSSQMNELYDSSAITGQATGSSGRWATNLSLKMQTARELWSSGELSELAVSLGWHYWLDAEMPAFGEGSYGQEHRSEWIAKQPQLVALNSLSAAPAFYYSGEPDVVWLDGWDEGCLADNEYYSIMRSMVFSSFIDHKYVTVGGDPWLTYPCVVSQSYMDSRGISLGDEFSVNILLDQASSIYGYGAELFISLKAVGSYSGGGTELYVPLSFWCDPDWITDDEALVGKSDRVSTLFASEEDRDRYFYYFITFSTCRFELASARNLDDFRSYLSENRYSEVGHIRGNRTAIILHDQTFTETVGALGRYIAFSRILFPVLFAVVGLLGFVISWLMINGRRMEFAILRGLGAPRGRVFLSFFLEQGGLCLLGCAVGGLILTLSGAGDVGWLAVGIFLVCYLAGCALSVLAVGHTKLMALLSERE